MVPPPVVELKAIVLGGISTTLFPTLTPIKFTKYSDGLLGFLSNGVYLIFFGCPIGPSLNDPEKLSDRKLGKQYENVDWYRFWVCERSDKEPLPNPNTPCGGTGFPVVFWRQPKV